MECLIGIKVDPTNEARKAGKVSKGIYIIKKKYKRKHIIVARDQLDSIRRVRRKLLAFEENLNEVCLEVIRHGAKRSL